MNSNDIVSSTDEDNINKTSTFDDFFEFCDNLDSFDTNDVESKQRGTLTVESTMSKSSSNSSNADGADENTRKKKRSKDLDDDNATSDRIHELMMFPQLHFEALNSNNLPLLHQIFEDFCLEDVIVRPPNMPPTKGITKLMEMFAYMYKATPDIVFTVEESLYQNGVITANLTSVGTYIGGPVEEERLYNTLKSPYRDSMIEPEVLRQFDYYVSIGKSMIITNKATVTLILNESQSFIQEFLITVNSKQISEVIPDQIKLS